MDSLREEVISNLRSCLISMKGKCDLATLRRDYHSLMGEQIPYVKLGYRNLEDFLCSIDSLTVCKGPNGQILVDAVSSQKTIHITQMINRQKTSKKKKPIRHVTFSETRAPSSKWRPKETPIKLRTGYNSSPRPAAVAHNQFVNHPKTPQRYATTTPPRYAKMNHPVNTKKPQVNAARNSVPENAENKTNDKCEALTSSKMRITKKMTEISLDSEGSSQPSSSNSEQRASGTPSPGWSPNRELTSSLREPHAPSSWNYHYQSSDVVPEDGLFEMTGNSIVDLENFIRFRSLPEMTLKMVERKTNKGRVTLHECNIKVGNNSYSNYPTEFCNPEMSKQYTAKLALDELMKKYGRRKSLLLSNEKDILERIPPMIEKHTNGIWNTQLEADYSDIYNEQLPSNWLEIVNISPNVYVEPVLDKFILRHCLPGEVFQKGNRSYGPLVSDVSVPVNTVHFSEEGELTAVVTCAVSAGEIWCRQIGTPESEAFENMSTRLEQIYNAQGDDLRAQNVKEGGYYIVRSEDAWLRVRVLDVTETDVNCFCIDTGEELTVTKRHVHQLKRECAVEQAQCFVCRLAGLEELYDCSKNSDHIANLVGKTVILDMNENSRNDPTDPSLAVVMYDVETRQCVNEQMINLVSCEVAAPVLKKDITEVYISHVEENGDVYVQVRSSAFERLRALLENLKNENLDLVVQLTPPVTPENSANRLYFLKKKADGDWYRVKFLDWAPTKQFVQIHYVDHGDCDIINVNEESLFPLDEVSEVVARYPQQALRVRMGLEKIPQNFVERFKRLVPRNTGVLLKNLGRTEGDVHVVDFFKRSEADEVLFSVTSAIEMENKKDGDSNNNDSRTTKLQRLMLFNNLPSAGLLKSPPIPQVGEYFDVIIPSAVSPYNFFVQPFESKDKLDRLMTALQERYNNSPCTPPQIEDIQPGKIYVSKHVDNLWYRTSVIKVIHAGSISVFYCDFGYYSNLTRQQLFPLDREFTELPYQAIKAKLVGIKPKQSKWTMDDCQFFQSLVCKKPFVSVVESKDKDELYKSDMVLHLRLIDTSTTADVYIHKVLMEKGIAVGC